jgi:hypothetical protein
MVPKESDRKCRISRNQENFTIDTAKVWNIASEKIRTAKSLAMAKKAIRAF